MHLPHAQFKAYRQLCGLTAEDVAKDLDVSLRTVQNWEAPAYDGKLPDYAEAYILNELAELMAKVNKAYDIVDNSPEVDCYDLSYKVSNTKENRKLNAQTRLLSALLLIDNENISIRYDSETTLALDTARKARLI